VGYLPNLKYSRRLNRMKTSDVLRLAVRRSEETRYRIAQATGIKESTLSRFVRGGGLNLASVDLLTKYFGLELVASSERMRKGK
jgi:hypothetical protein